MRETNLSGLSTRKDRNIRKSTSTFASAKMVMDLHNLVVVVVVVLYNVWLTQICYIITLKSILNDMILLAQH